MLKEVTSRGILFNCLLKCTYLDVKNDIELLKISFQYSIPLFIQSPADQ